MITTDVNIKDVLKKDVHRSALEVVLQKAGLPSDPKKVIGAVCQLDTVADGTMCTVIIVINGITLFKSENNTQELGLSLYNGNNAFIVQWEEQEKKWIDCDDGTKFTVKLL